MGKNLRKEFKARLKKLDWMTRRPKGKEKEKL